MTSYKTKRLEILNIILITDINDLVCCNFKFQKNLMGFLLKILFIDITRNIVNSLRRFNNDKHDNT